MFTAWMFISWCQGHTQRCSGITEGAWGDLVLYWVQVVNLAVSLHDFPSVPCLGPLQSPLLSAPHLPLHVPANTVITLS